MQTSATSKIHEIARTRCACTTIRGASRAITQLYDLVLAPTGLRATQFVILAAIGREGEIAQCRLANDYAVSVETLSRRLASLRRKGLVHVNDGFPHHQHIYTLTASGREELERAIPHWNRAQARLRATVGEADLKLLFDICERLVAGARHAQVIRMRNCAPPAVLAQKRKVAEEDFTHLAVSANPRD